LKGRLVEDSDRQGKERNPLRRLYNWTLKFAETRYAVWALFAVALAESVFFPIPPDVLLIALSIARPKRALFFALVSTAGSLTGAVCGYALGYYLKEPIAMPLIRFLGLTETFEKVAGYYREYAAVAVALAAFTPIPYKVFTIGAGICRVNFWLFLLVSTIFRSARFLLLALLCYRFGERAKTFIEKHINIVSLALAAVVVALILLLR